MKNKSRNGHKCADRCEIEEKEKEMENKLHEIVCVNNIHINCIKYWETRRTIAADSIQIRIVYTNLNDFKLQK